MKKRFFANKTYRNITAVLIMLLLLCFGGLAVKYLNEKNITDSSVAENNHISNNNSDNTDSDDKNIDHDSKIDSSNQIADDKKQTDETIRLDENKTYYKDALVFKEMYPGDSLSKTYQLEIEHQNTVKVAFEALIQEETKNLSNALILCLKDLNKNQILYEGEFSKVQNIYYELDKNQKQWCVEISVFAPKEMGNEYQMAELTADFHFYLDEDKEGSSITSDNYHVLFYAVLAIVAGVIIVLLLKRRNKHE